METTFLSWGKAAITLSTWQPMTSRKSWGGGAEGYAGKGHIKSGILALVQAKPQIHCVILGRALPSSESQFLHM